MADEADEPAEEFEPEPEPPAAPEHTEVSIEVGGHCISVRSPEPLHRVTRAALNLYVQTKDSARRIPLGFAAGPADTERNAGQRSYLDRRLDAWDEELDDRAKEVHLP